MVYLLNMVVFHSKLLVCQRVYGTIISGGLNGKKYGNIIYNLEVLMGHLQLKGRFS